MNCISIDNLLKNSHCSTINYFKNDKIEAHTISVRVYLPIYLDIEHELLTNTHFQLLFDFSKNLFTNQVCVLQFTPKINVAGRFISWLEKHCGEYFAQEYQRQIYKKAERNYLKKVS